MAVSQASSETFLPRQVVRRSAAIAERYRAREPESNPDPNAAPASAPAANGSTTADPQAPHADAADPRDNDPNYWKQRFRVTEGILSRERAERRSQFDTLNQRITELQEQTFTKAKDQPAAAAEIDLTKLYTPEQIEAYGEEQCRVMAMTATAVARNIAAEAVQPLREERTRTKEQDAADAKDRFMERLTELQPNWQVIDKNPRWLAWLDEEDENGAEPRALLNIHLGNSNAMGVAKLFKRWERENARPAPPLTPSGHGAAHGGEPPVPTPDEVNALVYPTPVETRDYFKRASLGKVRDDERVKFEARLKLRRP